MECAAITDAFEFERHIGLGSGVTDDSWGSSAGLFGQSAADVEAIEGYALAGRGHYAFVHRLGEDSVIHLAPRCGSAISTTMQTASRSVIASHPYSISPARAASVPATSLTPRTTSGWAATLRWYWGRSRSRARRRTPGCSATTQPRDRLVGRLSQRELLPDLGIAQFRRRGGRIRTGRAQPPGGRGRPGAWQIGARLDYIDLNDGDAAIRGGAPYSAIAGVNWHFSNYVRIMLDYALTWVINARNTPAAVDGSSNVIHGIGAGALRRRD